jgi:alcohol dehydrogenase class IV
VAEFRSHLAGLQVALFDGVFGNPTCAQVMAGAAAFRAHDADCVIGFGGGAALDVAKVVGLMATHEGDVLEYVWDHPQVRPIVHALPYFVAVPTTSGTGSEVGRSAVVSENDTHVKRTVFSPQILARAVFADPETDAGAAAGGDRRHRHGRAHAQHRELPVAGLAPAVRRHRARGPAHRRARAGHRGGGAGQPAGAGRHDDEQMMGAIAFQKDLGSVHACAHALGAVCGLHHGLANALMIDTVLDWNREACRPSSTNWPMWPAWPAAGRPSCPGFASSRPAGRHHGGLAAHGVREDQLAQLVPLAARDFTGGTNPRPATEADYERLFRQAM